MALILLTKIKHAKIKPMNIFQKIFGGRSHEKSAVGYAGGVSLLQKLVGPELGMSDLMQRYRKSLYVFACISKIAEKVGSIDVNMSQIMNSKGDMKNIVSSPLLDLIYRPNKMQTKSEFIMNLIINKKTAGSAFIYKVRNNSGKVVELWNLRPDMMTILTDPEKVIGGYRFRRGDGTSVDFPPEDIIYIKDYPDPLDQYSGISALMPASIRVQTEEYGTKYQRDFFLNSARPDAVLKSPKKLLPNMKAELKKNWNRAHQGVKNSSKIGLLEGGIEYQLISISQKDMDYIEGIKMTRDDILVAFRMTKTVLGITEDVNRANADAAMYVFLSEVIVPEMKAIIEKLNEEMTYIDFGENFILSFVDPTPQNREAVLNEYQNGVTNNWLLRNEIRQRENLPPVTGGWSFYMPLTDIAMGGLTQQQVKSLIKAIDKDSSRNEKIIDEWKKSQVKRYDFKGRELLRQKMMIYETLADEVVRQAKRKIKRKKSLKMKGKGISFISDPEVKKMYAEMVNKRIDLKSEQLKEAADGFFEAQKARVIAKLQKNAKSLKRKFNVDSIFDKSQEDGIAIDMIVPYIRQYLKDAGLESLEMIEPQAQFSDSTDRIKKFIKKRSEEFAESVNSTTLQGLEGTLSEGISAGEGIKQLSDRVEEVYTAASSYRSELIARTEATAANNEGILESYRQSSVVNGKEWIAYETSCEICLGMDGEIVPIEKSFSDGSQTPPAHPNCRCVMGAAFIE